MKRIAAHIIRLPLYIMGAPLWLVCAALYGFGCLMLWADEVLER